MSLELLLKDYRLTTAEISITCPTIRGCFKPTSGRS